MLVSILNKWEFYHSTQQFFESQVLPWGGVMFFCLLLCQLGLHSFWDLQCSKWSPTISWSRGTFSGTSDCRALGTCGRLWRRYLRSTRIRTRTQCLQPPLDCFYIYNTFQRIQFLLNLVWSENQKRPVAFKCFWGINV